MAEELSANARCLELTTLTKYMPLDHKYAPIPVEPPATADLVGPWAPAAVHRPHGAPPPEAPAAELDPFAIAEAEEALRAAARRAAAPPARPQAADGFRVGIALLQ